MAAGTMSSRERATPATTTPRIPLRNVLQFIENLPKWEEAPGRSRWRLFNEDSFESSSDSRKTCPSNPFPVRRSRATTGSRGTGNNPELAYLIRCEGGVVNLIFER